MTTPRQPRTPLRRISRGSLRALSASVTEGGHADPLAALMPVLGELGDQFQDLKTNMAALGRVDAALSTFNDAFASYLYGLKVNAYTGIFPEEPGPRNMQLARERRQVPPSSPSPSSQQHHTAHPQSVPFSSPSYDTTNLTSNDEEAPPAPKPAPTRGRGRGRGRIQPGKKLVDFAGPIVDTLPIKYRDDPDIRRQAESILGILKKHRDGLRIVDIVKQDSHMLQTHRVNDILLALLRAKHVQRTSHKGLVYSLDNRHL